VLWNITTASPFGGFFSGSTACADHGKYAVRLNDGHWHCWDLYSGRELWTSELSSWPWGTFGIYGVSSYGGLLIYPQYDGVVAYNWTNGKIAWRYIYEAQYPYETVFGNAYPFYDSAIVIADGKLYTSNTEHSPSNPITRGQKLHCINVTTGEGIWNITGSMSASGVADGYLCAGNRYDGYMYVFGRGKSATTVTAPDVTEAKGTSVVIKGTVLDQSPAQPNTPCVSTYSMATQMEYLHMQHPIDGIGHNITMTGVPVTLTAIDQSGGYVNIGTVTSSAYYGTFEMAWTPPAEGIYKIIASFAGDDSYGSSAAATAVSVGPAPAAIQFPQQVTPTDYTMTIIGAAIAIIIAVAIVGLALFLALRKR
jgi:outer membrane protein assembly factor BamB